MYNANQPNENELPSSKQLLISTFAAFVVAGILLVTAILPAEYGIDPTGIGKALGLKQMGEIKTQLAEEAAQENQVTDDAETEVQVDTESKAEPLPIEEPVSEPVVSTDSIQITLKTGQGAEVKVEMKEGQVTQYSWIVDKGHLNFDNHGDNPSTDYFNYKKGKAVRGDKGEIKAAFDGSHGWFWRNRSNETVTVTLEVIGTYASFKRVL